MPELVNKIMMDIEITNNRNIKSKSKGLSQFKVKSR